MKLFSFTSIEAIIAISNGEIQVTTKDIYYWITHYVFDDIDGITPKLIKLRVRQLVLDNGLLEGVNETKQKKKKKVKVEVDSSESLEEEIPNKKRVVRRNGHFF